MNCLPNISLNPVEYSNLEQAQRIFDAAKIYHGTVAFMKSDGMAERCLNAPLPEVRNGRVFKYFFLVRDNDLNADVALVDLFVGYPAYNQTTVATLIVADSRQKKGYGTAALAAIETFLSQHHPAVDTLLFSCTDNNIPCLKFLRKNNFERTDAWERITIDSRDFLVVTLSKKYRP